MNALAQYRQSVKKEDDNKRFERIEEKLDAILKALNSKSLPAAKAAPIAAPKAE